MTQPSTRRPFDHPRPVAVRAAPRALAVCRAGFLACAVAGALPAVAQEARGIKPEAEPAAARYRGTVVSTDHRSVEIRRPDGGLLTVGMTPRTRVYAVTPARIRDIKPESYVSVLGTPGPEPRRAQAVTLYAPSERGFEAGDRAWDTAPGASMTGGWIADYARAEPLRVELAYDGGRAAFAIPAGTPVTQLAPGEKAMLEPGAAVTVFARDRPDGTPEAGTIAVGRRGAVPAL